MRYNNNVNRLCTKKTQSNIDYLIPRMCDYISMTLFTIFLKYEQ